MSNGPISQSSELFFALGAEGSEPEPASEVELYWNRPPAAVRPDTARLPSLAADDLFLNPDGSLNTDSFACLWIDLGGGG